ncbi:MAG: metallophosphoesterase [Chthoniobacteraceae bacterium]
MPLHLPPLTRRAFLRRSIAAGAGLLTFPALHALESDADPDLWALLSDTHIAADRTAILRDVNMTDHLEAAVKGVRALTRRPAGVFVNGDCAVLKGLAEDYATFSTLITPLREDGLPIHLTLGNHDDREVFWTSLKNARPAAPPLASRQVSVVEGARANWFLLDSLDQVNKTPGMLGDEQRAWLAKALDAHTAKPALVMVHHNPNPAASQKKTGLLDTEQLLAILLPRRHVKALIFGHTHTWRFAEQDGLHLVNLPAVAYPFVATEVTGWVDVKLSEKSASLGLHAHDPQHAAHGKITEIAWRAA